MGSFNFSKSVEIALVSIVHRIYLFIIGARPLGKNGKVLRVELQHHKGLTVKLANGIKVIPGDQVMKLHFDHTWFKDKQKAKPSQTLSRQLEFRHDFRSDMQLLTAQLKRRDFSQVKAIYGWTFLYTPAARLGFQVLELPNTIRIRLARWYIGLLMRTYHVQENKRYRAAGKPIEIKAVWLSRDGLLTLYGSKSRT